MAYSKQLMLIALVAVAHATRGNIALQSAQLSPEAESPKETSHGCNPLKTLRLLFSGLRAKPHEVDTDVVGASSGLNTSVNKSAEAAFAAGPCLECNTVGFAAHHICQTMTAEEIKDRLIAGNERYLKGEPQPVIDGANEELRNGLAGGQKPSVAVVGCADSRCSPQKMFDNREGEMFVTRVAGNYVGSDLSGSLLYAVRHLGTKFVLVLGHTKCGAIAAAQSYDAQAGSRSASSKDHHLTNLIHSIKTALDDDTSFGDYFVKDDCDRALVQFQHGQPDLVYKNVVEQMGILKNVFGEAPGVVIAGAVFDLESGKVNFLDQYVTEGQLTAWNNACKQAAAALAEPLVPAAASASTQPATHCPYCGYGASAVANTSEPEANVANATQAAGSAGASGPEPSLSGFFSKIATAAAQGATAATVAAILSACTEPLVNRLLVKRMTFAEAWAELTLASTLQFFLTTFPTNMLKFPAFEVINMALSFTSLSGAVRGVVNGFLFCTLMLPVTNYRFRKSMGWEIKPSLLYQAYIPTVTRDIIYGWARGVVGGVIEAAVKPDTLLLKAAVFGATIWAACIISSPCNEWRGYTLQPAGKALPFFEYFKPVNYARSTGIGATIMGIALAVSMLITPLAEKAIALMRDNMMVVALAIVVLAGVFLMQSSPKKPDGN